MPKRGENIRKRKDGRWEARYRNGFDKDGTPVYRSVYGKTYKEAKEEKSSDYVVSTTACFVSPRTFEYRFHAILKKHHIPDISFHGLRHTFATRCIERSVDIKSLSQILGHSSETITLKTYIHSSLEMKRIQIEKLN